METRGYPRRHILVLAGGLLLLGAGLWLDVNWYSHRPSAALYLVNIVPGLALLVGWFFTWRWSRQSWLQVGQILVAGLLAFGLVVVVNLGAMAVVSATTPEHQPASYEEILGYYNNYDDELVSHFPLQIPETATDVSFYHLPAFLQGGSRLQLRCTLPSSDVDEIIQRLLPEAQQVRSAAGDVLEASDDRHVPSISLLYEDNSERVPLPEDFLLLVLGAEPYEPGNWNHGYTYGVAVSEERHEVIYWRESW